MDLISSYSIYSKNKRVVKDLLLKLNKDPKTIQKTTGINNTRIFSKDIKIKDLFNKLIKIAKLEKNIKPSNILVCTQTPDESMPSISSQLAFANKFSLIESCIDINAGCTGFVDLSRLAQRHSHNSTENYIFCLSGDLNSRIVNIEDYALSCVFGDLINLSIFRSSKFSKENINPFQYTVSLKQSKCIKRELNESLEMNGMDVMTFVCDTVLPALIKFLSEVKLKQSLDEFSLVLHQANEFIVNFINRKVKSKFPEITTHDFCMQEIGNSGSSTIPYAIQNYFLKGKLKNKSIICGYGVGMSVSIGIINLDENFSNDDIMIIET